MTKKQQILLLRSEGKTYDEIKSIVSCSKSTIAYHCGPGQAEKSKARVNKLRTNPEIRLRHNISRRYTYLLDRSRSNRCTQQEFNDLIRNTTKCAITGDPINIYEESWEVDHIVPITRGGTNDISNLQITTRRANAFKSDMLEEELIQVAIKLLKTKGISYH